MVLESVLPLQRLRAWSLLKSRDFQISLKFCHILLIRHMPVEFLMKPKQELKFFVFRTPCYNQNICRELLLAAWGKVKLLPFEDCKPKSSLSLVGPLVVLAAWASGCILLLTYWCLFASITCMREAATSLVIPDSLMYVLMLQEKRDNRVCSSPLGLTFHFFVYSLLILHVC